MMYYYNDGENEVGPFAISRLKRLHENGLIADGTLVRSSESSAWIPIHELLSKTKLGAVSAGSSPELTARKHEGEKKAPSPEFAPRYPSAEGQKNKHLDELEGSRQKTKPQSIEKAQSVPDDGSAPPQTAQPVASGKSPTGSKPLQSNDPAYKYIPRNRRISPELNLSSTRDAKELIDPAYKFIPRNKRTSPESEPQTVSETSGPVGWLSVPPTPWRRYAARILDTSLNGALGFIVFAIVFFSIAPATADSFFFFLESGAGLFLNVLLAGFMASIIGGALIGVSGFTLGKLIFGVKVVRRDGANLGIGAAVFRDLEVWIKGMGLGIPIIALLTMWFSYSSLTKDRTTSWDKGKYEVYHRPSGPAQYVLNVLGLIAILLILGSLRAIAQV